jgi:hypothetical protein
MVEPTDAIMPILQGIQADIAEIKRSQAVRFDSIDKTLADHTEKLREMNGYLSFNLGITVRHTSEIDAMRVELDAIKRRLSALEHQH